MIFVQKESHAVVEIRPWGTLPFWENKEILIIDPMWKSLVWKDTQFLYFVDLKKLTWKRKSDLNGVFCFVLLIQNTSSQDKMLHLDFPTVNSIFLVKRVNWEATMSISNLGYPNRLVINVPAYLLILFCLFLITLLYKPSMNLLIVYRPILHCRVSEIDHLHLIFVYCQHTMTTIIMQ